jgi:hypothetical protein
LNQYSFDKEKIVEALQQKAESQGVELRLDEGVPDEDIGEVEAYWDRALDRLVTEKPEFETVVDRINNYLQALSEQ